MTHRIETRNINGVELHVEVHGQGPRVVFVHGSWGDADNWAAVTGPLGRDHEVVTYDRRGHTRSGDGTGPGSRLEDAEDLAALVESFGDGPVALVGGSFGGAIVLTLIETRPDLVTSAVVHEPPLFPLLAGVEDPAIGEAVAESTQAQAEVHRLLAGGDIEAGTIHFVEHVALGPGAWATLPPDRRQAFLGNAHTYLDELEDPHALDVDVDAVAGAGIPLLVSRGTVSPQPLMAIADRLADRVPMATAVVLDGAGHVPHLTHPDVYVETITRFWSRLGAGSTPARP